MEITTETSTKTANRTENMVETPTRTARKKKVKHAILVSKHLSPTQIRGVLKAGDVIIPGDDRNFPRFSETHFIHHIDRMLDHMTVSDREGVCLLFGLFAWMPAFAIGFLMALAKNNQKFPNLIGAPLRMIYIGVRGVFFTLYYSNLEDPHSHGEKIFRELKWDAKVTRRPEDRKDAPERAPALNNPSLEDTKNIYETAREASRELKRLTVKQRVRYVAALKSVIMQRREEIIDRIQQDTGKSRSDALFSEIFPVLDHLHFLEGEAQKALKDKKIKTPIALMGKSSKVFHEPLGTVLVISPWNYPFYQAITPITTSLVTGNATIYKPSEITPLTGLVEDVLEEAGVPSEWVQVVYGDGATGSQLIEQRPAKIFFTGSVNTGKKIMEQAAKQLIPVELELGGKDPMIVFEDTNVERAVAGAAWGAFTNTGQSCTSVERLYVQENIYLVFKEKLVRLVEEIVQATDKDGDADIGAMTSKTQVGIVKKHLDDALAKGAKQLTGSHWDGKSPMIPPIVLEDVTDDMLVVKEETFGPILPIMSFVDEAEVIWHANNSDYGLSASVWSADKKRVERVARALETGNVSINNVMLTEGNHHLPFGGIKDSGFGRYKGHYGLHSFSNIKSVLFDGNSNNIEVNWYPYTKEKYRLFANLMDGLFTGGLWGFIKFAVNGLKAEGHANKVGKKGRKAS